MSNAILCQRLRDGVDPHDPQDAELAMDTAADEIERLSAVLKDYAKSEIYGARAREALGITNQ